MSQHRETDPTVPPTGPGRGRDRDLNLPHDSHMRSADDYGREAYTHPRVRPRRLTNDLRKNAKEALTKGWTVERFAEEFDLPLRSVLNAVEGGFVRGDMPHAAAWRVIEAATDGGVQDIIEVLESRPDTLSILDVKRVVSILKTVYAYAQEVEGRGREHIASATDRLWSRVSILYEPPFHWVWSGPLANGYPVVWWGGRTTTVVRVLYNFARDAARDGPHLTGRDRLWNQCGEPLCVNPAHYRVGRGWHMFATPVETASPASTTPHDAVRRVIEAAESAGTGLPLEVMKPSFGGTRVITVANEEGTRRILEAVYVLVAEYRGLTPPVEYRRWCPRGHLVTLSALPQPGQLVVCPRCEKTSLVARRQL